MNKPKIYIDGKEGTTGLQIYERLGGRDDLELLLIDEDKRKDTEERRKFLNAADLVFLCLPDAAAVEAVSLIENGNTKVIDASTAHRTAPGWAKPGRKRRLVVSPSVRAMVCRDSSGPMSRVSRCRRARTANPLPPRSRPRR